MTEKEYELAKAKLNRYREMTGRVGRLTEEAARWNAMAEIAVMECRRTGGRSNPKDMGTVKSTAMAIEAERDALAVKAMEQRRQLCACIAMIGSDIHRDILERIYLGGSSSSEAADALHVTERTIARRLRRAIELLKSESDFFKSP